jgi:hypothetical protein
MTEFVSELDFFRREALTAQQQFFIYLAMHRVPFDDPPVLNAMNREPLLWLTLRETSLQGAITSLGRILDTTSRHNVGSLLNTAAKSLEEFSRASLTERKVAAGVTLVDAETFVQGKHELGVQDIRELKREAAALRRIWEDRYRDIRHKVYAHSEVIQTSELFAKTRIDDLVDMLDRLEILYEDLWDAFHNGRQPGTRRRARLKFPVPAKGSRAGESVYRQAQAVLKRLAGLPDADEASS